MKTYLHCIYCKVKTTIQGEKCHTLRSRCACAWIYIVANLILLCSLKHISLVWNLKNFHKKTWAILFISFFGQASEYPLFSISRTLVHFSILFIFHSFMNNFCIATCFFSATKLLRDNNKNLEHLFGG